MCYNSIIITLKYFGGGLVSPYKCSHFFVKNLYNNSDVGRYYYTLQKFINNSLVVNCGKKW